MNLPVKLNLTENDPIQLMKKLSDLKTMTESLNISITQTMAILHEIYYNKGVDFLTFGDRFMAKNMFNKSLMVNPKFAPALYQLAKMDFEDKLYDDAKDKLLTLFSTMYPDPNTSTLAMKLCNSVYYAFLQQGDELQDDGKFETALEIYDKAEKFCRAIPNLSCSDVMYESIAKARYGIYKKILLDAENYLKNGNLQEAEKQTLNAINYQKKYSENIPNANEAYNLLNKIKGQEYFKLITNGESELKIGKYQSAFEKLVKAQEMESQYTFEKYAKLPDLLKQTAKHIIIADIEKGKDLIQSNKVQEAKQIVSSAMSMQNKYGLSEDKTINSMLKELKEKIFTQECINAQNDYDTQLKNAKQNIILKQFLEAEKFYDKAIKIAMDNLLCNINKSFAENGKFEILPAITYQKLLVEVQDLINTSQETRAISRYKEAEKYFYRMEVAKFGIEHKPLDEFATQKSSKFILATVSYFTTQTELDKALKLLKVLNTRNFSAKLTKPEQTNLGIQLAIRDKKQNPVQNPKVIVLQYTDGNKWFKILQNAYMKQWKKI